MSSESVAFMSYVRSDDLKDEGLLDLFRRRLSAEVSLQIGSDFRIWVDRNDIAWGENWQARINEALDASTLLIPIVTPSFFRSSYCREEVARFLQREEQLGRNDLIVPIYYISSPQMDDPLTREADQLGQALSSRQVADWRELRFEPPTSPVFRKALAQLASQVRDALAPEDAVATKPGAGEGRATEGAAPSAVAAKYEPPTHLVDAFYRGDFSTIGAAIAAAAPGDRILVRPGLYNEGLVLDKPLELIGDGSVQDIQVEVRGQEALLFRANIGRVANLTFRQVGGDDSPYAVDIAQGRLELEGCDISGRGPSSVAIHSGADPRLRRNRIHDGGGAAVYVYDNGLGVLEDNDISGHAGPGVVIQAGGDPTLRRNQIRGNRGPGVYVHNGGLGTLEDNEIIENGRSGVEITSNSECTLRYNRISGNGSHAVRVLGAAGGLIQGNTISGNAQDALSIDEDSQETVRLDNNIE